MFVLMIVVFIIGYTMIALEHPIKVDKAASALLTGVISWVLLMFGADEILGGKPGFEGASHEELTKFIYPHSLLEHLSEISEILFFLLGAMTIVEMVDRHQGFKLITDKIRTTNKVKLLWIISFITFFMSAVLDNLTTTIVLVALLRKLIDDKKTRWFYAAMVVLAANAGGAWSPIGDVTTIMLWVKGNITTVPTISFLIVPSLVSMVVPLLLLSFIMKGNVTRPADSSHEQDMTTPNEKLLFLILGVAALLFVPVFKTITHLPPYLGMLFGLGVIWVVSEILHRHKPTDIKKGLSVATVLTKIDMPTVLFFLGILTAVAALQTAGHLSGLAVWMNDATGQNIVVINTFIGVLSSIVDNVPLVAGAMGMYEIAGTGAVGHAADFVVDGHFWQLLAYCAGTGGSILIIGSAAGVAAMGLEKIDFIWYLKRISLLALLGYLSGVATYVLMWGGL
ncbi:MAG: sodium:proton antiporter [Bacteroidetes bacterium GWF2_38_335]|nr:MAG: sodium:proton antiporter [Bacteroidetes bacterium GWF2_38_335]OFY79094.1 MAG: sodium:proton antiporter [Bacteroidetes bacterium RIFOXYA12_FULL_38_20]HBS88821.1 sodium:proton antiporter [Bacteroidales bacterium]